MEPLNKYVVFKRDTFDALISHDPEMLHRYEIPDAVVIRRQDKFASPALATYAAMISMVAVEHSDPDVSKELLTIADYFEHQAQLAAEEGYKLPD